MTDALIVPGSAEFNALFTSFQRSAYRLETLQSYGSPDEDAFYAAFLAGEPFPHDAGKDWWVSNVISPAVAAGRSISRVHIVREQPLSDYMRFELTWAYAPNVAAGDDIRIIPVADGAPWPVQLPEETDYWLIDDQMYELVYADDEVRTWLGARLVDDRERVGQARAWRDIALELSVPWREYIAARPELSELLPATS